MGEGGSRGGGAGTRAWIFSRRASGPAYTAQYPDVISLKSEIAALERVPKTTAAVGEEFPAHRRHQTGPASPLAAGGSDRDRTGPGRARLLSPRERQRPTGLSLLARNALSGRQIPRSARNLA